MHEPIHSVRLPGPGGPPGGRLRRGGADADDPPRLDLARVVHAGGAAGGAEGRARRVAGRGARAAAVAAGVDSARPPCPGCVLCSPRVPGIRHTRSLRRPLAQVGLCVGRAEADDRRDAHGRDAERQHLLEFRREHGVLVALRRDRQPTAPETPHERSRSTTRAGRGGLGDPRPGSDAQDTTYSPWLCARDDEESQNTHELLQGSDLLHVAHRVCHGPRPQQ